MKNSYIHINIYQSNENGKKKEKIIFNNNNYILINKIDFFYLCGHIFTMIFTLSPSFHFIIILF